jgi:hypothetical protein
MERSRSRASGGAPAAPQSQTSPPERTEQPLGNAAAAQGTGSMGAGSIASQMPSLLELQELGVNFRLPPGVNLTEGWNPLTTGEGSTVFVRLSPRGLEVSLSPPLVVDAQWPMSNVEIRGFSYDFASGTVSNVSVANTQTFAIGAKGFVEDAIREYVGKLVAGTPLAARGYNPLTDPNVRGTMEALQANAGSAGGSSSGPAPLGLEDLGQITPTATIALREEIVQGTPEGGVRIPAGTSITLYAGLAGTAQDLASGGLGAIEYISLSSPGIELRSGDSPVALLQELKLSHGGGVDVQRFQPLGKLKDAATMESGLRALVALLQVGAAQRGGYSGPIHTNVNPDIVEGVAESQLEKALGAAVRGVVDQHHDAIPGLDLRAALGMPASR